MNLSSWTKYDCRSWIVHEYSWIVHEYWSSHEFHFAGEKPNRCRKCWNYMRKVLPSELTNTIGQFSVYFIGMKHISPIYVSYQCIWGWRRLQKPSPKCNFPHTFCYFYFTLGSTHDSADCWSADTDPQLPAIASNVGYVCTTDARPGGVGWVTPQTKILALPVPLCCDKLCVGSKRRAL